MHVQWQLYLYNMKNVPQMYTARKQFRTICNIYVLSPSVETVLSVFLRRMKEKKKASLATWHFLRTRIWFNAWHFHACLFNVCIQSQWSEDASSDEEAACHVAPHYLDYFWCIRSGGLKKRGTSSPHLLLSYKLLLIPRGTARSSSSTSKKMKSNLWLIQWSTSAPKKLQMNSGEYRECVGNLSDTGTHVIILLNGALSCIWESVQLD